MPRRRLLGLLLLLVAMMAVPPSPARAHHRHTYFYRFENFLNAPIPVYNCSANAATLQTAIANWNANGGLGTIFSYAGTSCSAQYGIVAKSVSMPDADGRLLAVQKVERPHEALKDATQEGRLGFAGGLWNLVLADLQIHPNKLTTVNVYSHELGHAVGLNEHYPDVLDTPVVCLPAYPIPTIMDCPDTDTGPRSHDASDGQGRYYAVPWGPGAIWLTNDLGTQLKVNWGDVNDNETKYEVWQTTAPGPGGQMIASVARDTEWVTAKFLSPQTQYCFYLKAYRGTSSNTSSQICRYGQPGQPTAPSAPEAYGGPNNYTADLYWTINDSSYTHSIIDVYADGYSGKVARYYVPYSGTGTMQKFIALGVNDHLPRTYYIYVATCNQNWNAWYGNCRPSAGGAYASIYLSN